MDLYENETKILTLDCKHVYHAHCLRKWVLKFYDFLAQIKLKLPILQTKIMKIYYNFFLFIKFVKYFNNLFTVNI